MAGIKLSLTPDCRLLTYTLQGVNTEIMNGDGNLEDSITDVANIEIYNNGSLISTEQNPIFPVDQSGAYVNTYTISVPDVIGTDPGIITLIMQDSTGSKASAAILASCELDCCLASKVLDLTKCTDCSSKCSKQLSIAQKIFLYMESIRTTLSQLGDDITTNEGMISQSLDTYNAAKELCSDHCGCNC